MAHRIPSSARDNIGLWLIPLALCGGCSGEAIGEEIPSEEALGQLEQPITSVSEEFVWQQGQPAVFMGDWRTRTCFLTGMSGKFEGWGEYVHVYVLPNPTGANWFLEGSSFQTGVSARARCIDRDSVDMQFYSWSQYDGGPVDMGAASNQVCTLQMIQGRFASANEFVRIQRNSQNRWFLDGDSAQEDVFATAGCFRTLSVQNTEYKWLATQLGSTAMAVNPNPNSRNYCFLTYVGGNFDSGSHNVRARYDDFGSQWFLSGTVGSGGRQARARCASN